MLEMMQAVAARCPSNTTMLGVVTIIFAVTNAKGLPLAYTLRLLPSLYRIFRPGFAKNPATTTTKQPTVVDTKSVAALPILFRHHTTTSRAIALDCDVNLHKSNSTFFMDADISRAALLTTLLSESLAARVDDATGRAQPAMFMLAGVQCRFAREIKPYAAYDVSSRVLAWNAGCLYVVTYFLRPGTRLPAQTDVVGGPGAVLGDQGLRRSVFATMITKYVFKAGRTTVPPQEVLFAAGLLIGVDGEKEIGVPGLLQHDKLEEAVKNGLAYVKECMD